MLTRCVAVKIRYSDFETHSIQKSIAYTNADHVLLKVTKALLDQAYRRRVMVRLIGIRFSNLISGNYQINLFADTEEDIKLYQAIDSIKRQFGERFPIRSAGI